MGHPCAAVYGPCGERIGLPVEAECPEWKSSRLTHAFHYGNHADMESPLISYRRERDISQKDLAEVLGIRTPALCKWERGRVPAARVLDVERATGISRHQLRPDVFGPPAEAAA